MRKTNAALLQDIDKLEAEVRFWKDSRERVAEDKRRNEETIKCLNFEVNWLRKIVENLSKIEVMSRG